MRKKLYILLSFFIGVAFQTWAVDDISTGNSMFTDIVNSFLNSGRDDEAGTYSEDSPTFPASGFGDDYMGTSEEVDVATSAFDGIVFTDNSSSLVRAYSYPGNTSDDYEPYPDNLFPYSIVWNSWFAEGDELTVNTPGGTSVTLKVATSGTYTDADGRTQTFTVPAGSGLFVLVTETGELARVMGQGVEYVRMPVYGGEMVMILFVMGYVALVMYRRKKDRVAQVATAETDLKK